MPALQTKVELSTDAPMSAAPTWTDISAQAKNIKITRGRQDRFSIVQAGSATFDLTNEGGRLSVANTSSPFYPNLRKNNRIRISIIYNTVTYVRLVGYVNEWPVQWEGKHSVATVTCTDVFKLLARYDNSRGNYAEQALAAKPVAFYPMDEQAPATTLGNYSAASVNPVQGALVLNQVSRATGSAALGDSAAPDAGTGVKFTPQLATRHTRGDTDSGGKPTPQTGVANNIGCTLVQGNLPAALPANWAIDLWLRMPPLNADDEMAIMCLNTSGGAATQLDVVANSMSWRGTLNGHLALVQRTGDGTNPSFLSIYQPAVAAGHIADDRLHMVTLEYTAATHTLTPYVDGVSLGATTQFTLPSGWQYVTLGGRDDRRIGFPQKNGNGGLWAFVGTLSNLAVYDQSNGSYNTPASRFLAGRGWRGDLASDRITRLLAYQGVPGAFQNITTASQYVGPQALRSKSLLAAAQDCAQVEDMPLYVSKTGLVSFQPRSARVTYAGTVTLDAKDCPDLKFSDDDAYIVNTVEISGTSKGTQTIANMDGGTSISRYGPYRRTLGPLPLYTDQQGVDLARRILARWSDPPARLGQVRVEGQTQGATIYPNLLNAEINWQLTVNNLPPEAPTPATTYSCVIEGVEETIDLNSHYFDFYTSPITTADANETRSGDTGVWRLGVTGHNELGTNTIAEY